MVQPTLLDPPTAAEVAALEAENERLLNVISDIAHELDALYKLLPENKCTFVESTIKVKIYTIHNILDREGLR